VAKMASVSFYEFSFLTINQTYAMHSRLGVKKTIYKRLPKTYRITQPYDIHLTAAGLVPIVIMKLFPLLNGNVEITK
jgi:hypothetical protein